MSLKYPDTLESNNTSSTGYAIVKGNQVSGAHNVADLDALYQVYDYLLSPSGNNTGSDAIGFHVYVVSENASYKLVDWEKRHEADGWTRSEGLTSDESEKLEELSGLWKKGEGESSAKRVFPDSTDYNFDTEEYDSYPDISACGDCSTNESAAYKNPGQDTAAFNYDITVTSGANSDSMIINRFDSYLPEINLKNLSIKNYSEDIETYIKSVSYNEDDKKYHAILYSPITRIGLSESKISLVIGSIGQHSHSEGFATSSYGVHSHAEGRAAISYGANSHAEGNLNVSIGDCSHTEGAANVAKGAQSHSEGTNTMTIGQSSHAEGILSLAQGVGSHAEGYSSIAYGVFSHSENYDATAIGSYSHAEGGHSNSKYTVTLYKDHTDEESGYTYYQANLGSPMLSGSEVRVNISYDSNNKPIDSAVISSSPDTSILELFYRDSSLQSLLKDSTGYKRDVEGNFIVPSNISSTYRIVREGSGTTESPYKYYVQTTDSSLDGKTIGCYLGGALSQFSHVEGTGNMENGGGDGRNHIEGSGNLSVNGHVAHVEGAGQKIFGAYIHAEGTGNIAYGHATHVEGAGQVIISSYSHAEGSGNTMRDAAFSHIEGAGNYSNSVYTHVEGSGNAAYNSGSYSHIEGCDNMLVKVKGNANTSAFSHMEGSGNSILGGSTNVHMEGAGNKITGECLAEDKGMSNSHASHIEGVSNVIDGYFNEVLHIEGAGNRVLTKIEYKQSGSSSWYNTSRTHQVHLEGTNNTVTSSEASGDITSVHIEGCSNAASDVIYNTHIEGSFNVANNGINNAHLEGVSNKALSGSNQSHAEGYHNIIYGTSSAHAEGEYHYIPSYSLASHAEGIGTVAIKITKIESYVYTSGGVSKTKYRYYFNMLQVPPASGGTANYPFISFDTSVSVFDWLVGGMLMTKTDVTQTHDISPTSEYNPDMNYVVYYVSMKSSQYYVEFEGDVDLDVDDVLYGNAGIRGNAIHLEGISNASIGNFSHVEGQSNYSYGFASHVEGRLNIIYGSSSHENHAEGAANRADNTYLTHIEGCKNKIAGSMGSHMEGIQNTVALDSSYSNSGKIHVEGSNNIVRKYAYTSHVEGEGNISESAHSHVEGLQNKNLCPDGAGSGNAQLPNHVEGIQNTVESGYGVHVQGYSNSVSSGVTYIHVEGSLNNISGIGSGSDGLHVEGTLHHLDYHAIIDDYSATSYNFGKISKYTSTTSRRVYGGHVEGCENAFFTSSLIDADEDYTRGDLYFNHLEGGNNRIDGSYSHVEGRCNVSVGYGQHIEGSHNLIAPGYKNGNTNINYSAYVHVEGMYNSVTSSMLNCAHIEGAFHIINCSDSPYIHIGGYNNVIDNAKIKADFSVVEGQYNRMEVSSTSTITDTFDMQWNRMYGYNNCIAGYKFTKNSFNTIDGYYNVITDGFSNHVTGYLNSISGYQIEDRPAVLTTYSNTVSGQGNTIIGGYFNTVGGYGNRIEGGVSFGNDINGLTNSIKDGSIACFVRGDSNYVENGSSYSGTFGRGSILYGTQGTFSFAISSGSYTILGDYSLVNGPLTSGLNGKFSTMLGSSNSRYGSLGDGPSNYSFIAASDNSIIERKHSSSQSVSDGLLSQYNVVLGAYHGYIQCAQYGGIYSSVNSSIYEDNDVTSTSHTTEIDIIAGGVNNKIYSKSRLDGIFAGCGNMIHNYTEACTIVGGILNEIHSVGTSSVSTRHAFIGGGESNEIATSTYASIVGSKDSTIEKLSMNSSIVGSYISSISSSSGSTIIASSESNISESDVSAVIASRHIHITGAEDNTYMKFNVMVNSDESTITGESSNNIMSASYGYLYTSDYTDVYGLYGYDYSFNVLETGTDGVYYISGIPFGIDTEVLSKAIVPGMKLYWSRSAYIRVVTSEYDSENDRILVTFGAQEVKTTYSHTFHMVGVNNSRFSLSRGALNNISQSNFAYVFGCNNSVSSASHSFITGYSNSSSNDETIILGGHGNVANHKNVAIIDCIDVTSDADNTVYLPNVKVTGKINIVEGIEIGGVDFSEMTEDELQAILDNALN